MKREKKGSKGQEKEKENGPKWQEKEKMSLSEKREMKVPRPEGGSSSRYQR